MLTRTQYILTSFKYIDHKIIKPNFIEQVMMYRQVKEKLSIIIASSDAGAVHYHPSVITPPRALFWSGHFEQ